MAGVVRDVCLGIIDRTAGFSRRKDIWHRKALDAMFCDCSCEDCTVAGLGVDFMCKVVSDGRGRYGLLGEKPGAEHAETTWEMFPRQSPAAEGLKMKCGLFGVGHGQCRKVIPEWMESRR